MGARSNPTLADDRDVIKVYIDLAGPLIDISKDDVDAEFDDRSFVIWFNTPEAYYKFQCERTLHPIDPARCSKMVTKARKLLIKLHKCNHMENWPKLKAAA